MKRRTKYQLMFLPRDCPFFAITDCGPLSFGHYRPGDPIHVQGEIVESAQKGVGRDRALLQHPQEVFRSRFENRKLAQKVERLVLHRDLPTVLVGAVLELYQFIHYRLPRACGGGGITRLPIHAGQLATESRSVLGFILRGDKPMGFVFVAGLEGLLLAGDEVFAVIGAPGAEEYAVALFHVLFHVVNMNQLDSSPLASSVRGCLGF